MYENIELRGCKNVHYYTMKYIEALWQNCYQGKLVEKSFNLEFLAINVLSLQGKRVVSERVEKSSAVGLSGDKHSTEGRGQLLDTTAGRRDCPKSQVTKRRQTHPNLTSGRRFNKICQGFGQLGKKRSLPSNTFEVALLFFFLSMPRLKNIGKQINKYTEVYMVWSPE